MGGCTAETSLIVKHYCSYLLHTTHKICYPLAMDESLHFCQQVQTIFLNKSVMKWHGHRSGSQDSKMEGERLLEVYLHRPQAKKPQHLCKVLCRQQSGKRMRGQRETQRAAPGQRPDSPEGTAGLKPLCWSSLYLLHWALLWPGTSRPVSHLVQKKDLQKRPVVATEVAPAVGQVTPEQLSLAALPSHGHWEKLQKCLVKWQQFLLERIDSLTAVDIRRD